MRIATWTRSLVLSLFILLIALPLSAQTSRGSIAGTVQDASGAALPHAKIVITGEDTGFTREMESTGSGDYSFQDLQIGNYTLTVTMQGFSTTKVEHITVRPGQVYALDPKMSVNATNETVEVSASTVAIDAVSSTNNNVVNEKAVANIPLNGRDFTQLLRITPGVNGAGSVNGARTNQNNYQIDGSDANDIWHNSPAANQGGVGPIAGVTLPIEAIDQFTVQSSGNAEAGRNAGGLISMALKTGTNKLHGSAYYYTRNEFFAARDFFQADTARKQKVRNQQFGASVGGPVLKDKLFFFLNYERQKYVIQLPSSNATEPGAAYVQRATQLLNRHGVQVNPLSLNLLQNLWMAGNAPGLAATQNNYVEQNPRVGYSDNTVGNLNYIISPKQTLRAQAFIGTGRQIEPGGTTYWYFQAAPTITQNFSLTHNWQVTDHFSNQLLGAVGVFNQTFNDNRHDFNIPALGLNTGVTNPSLFGAPTINISAGTGAAFDTVGSTQPLGRKDYVGHITNTSTWVHGKHQTRFGGEYRRNYMDLQYQNGVRGNFTFNGITSATIALPNGASRWSASSTQATVCTVAAGCTSNDADIVGTQTEILALADYLAGYYNSSSFLAGVLRRDIYRTDLSFFAQDQYHILPKLTLNYGLRYEYTGAMSSTGPLSVFRPGAAGTDAFGLLAVGNSGKPSSYNPGRLHFSPRVGINFNPTDKLVVRASYGLYFDNPPFNGFLDTAPGTTGTTARGVQANPLAGSGVQNVSTGPRQWQTGVPVFAGASGLSQVGLASIAPNLKMAYANNFNLTTEYQVSKNTVATLAYVGSTGVNLYTMLDVNQPAAWSTSAPGNTSGVTSNGSPVSPNSASNLCSLSANATNANCLLQRRPVFLAKSVTNWTSVAAVNQVSSRGNSNYHALQASFKANNYHGVTAQASWTYGHSLDNTSGFRSTGPMNSYNLSQDYGNATFDIRHTFNGYIVYDIPQLFHAWPALTKGWQVTGYATAYTGAPFSITVSDNTGRGQAKDRANWNGTNYKTGASDVTFRPSSTTKIVQYWVRGAASGTNANAAGFSTPAIGQTGNTARNQFRGPGFFTTDASLIKNTQIRERVSLQLRAEMFNITNHLNMGNPNTTITNANFGEVTAGRYSTAISSGAPFNVQFAGRLVF